MEPINFIKAYKLFRFNNNKLFPLFIGSKQETPLGVWIDAQSIPTKGYAPRPGWHSGILPIAPHLRTKKNKISPNRVWAEVNVPADVDWQFLANLTKTKDIRNAIPANGYYRFKTNKRQGFEWIISGAIRVNKILTDAEIREILTINGHPDQAVFECKSG